MFKEIDQLIEVSKKHKQNNNCQTKFVAINEHPHSRQSEDRKNDN